MSPCKVPPNHAISHLYFLYLDKVKYDKEAKIGWNFKPQTLGEIPHAVPIPLHYIVCNSLFLSFPSMISSCIYSFPTFIPSFCCIIYVYVVPLFIHLPKIFPHNYSLLAVLDKVFTIYLFAKDIPSQLFLPSVIKIF